MRSFITHHNPATMKNLIFNTSETMSPLILRRVLGIVVFVHGAQKLFGWFGGYGFEGTMSYFTGDVGLPWIIGLLVILLETIGSLALVVGLGTRLVAAAFTMLAFGILMTVHLQNGFFMNWSNNQNGEGYEYFLLWLAISIALIISGAGRLSVDRKIAA